MATLTAFIPQETTTSTYAGQCIHEHRIAAGRTVQSVADALNLSQPYITQVETGKRIAPPETLHRIAAELGIASYVMYDAYMRDGKSALRRQWLRTQP